MYTKRQAERIQMLELGVDEQSLFDLSRGGVCCYHDRELRKGVAVRVVINGLKLDARVIFSMQHAVGFRTGLQFYAVGNEEQKKIDEFVDRFSRGVPMDCAVIESPSTGSAEG